MATTGHWENPVIGAQECGIFYHAPATHATRTDAAGKNGGRSDVRLPCPCAMTSTFARLHKIAARHGASNLRLFGSVARGERPDSDVDLLTDLAEDRGS
jgi:hypothetical protein